MTIASVGFHLIVFEPFDKLLVINSSFCITSSSLKSLIYGVLFSGNIPFINIVKPITNINIEK